MDNTLWVEAYRPSTIDECILPVEIKKTFKSILNQGDIPNLLLSGTAGTGKTTVAKALCNELDCDVMVINGSDEGRSIDVVRNQIKNFAQYIDTEKDPFYIQKVFEKVPFILKEVICYVQQSFLI